MPSVDPVPLAGGSIAVWAVLLSLLSALISATVTATVIVRLPPEAFEVNRLEWPKSLSGRLLRIGTNLIGWTLVALGVVLSIPGVPGQGILTILLGLLLVDFPGRRWLLRRILGVPRVQRTIDRLRGRFGRPPIEWNRPSP